MLNEDRCQHSIRCCTKASGVSYFSYLHFFDRRNILSHFAARGCPSGTGTGNCGRSTQYVRTYGLVILAILLPSECSTVRARAGSWAWAVTEHLAAAAKLGRGAASTKCATCSTSSLFACGNFRAGFEACNSHLSSSLTFRSPRIQYRQKCMQLWQVPIEKDCDRLAWIKCLEFDLHQESHDSHWTASWMVCARSFGDEGLISHLDFRKLRTPIFSYIQHFLIIRKPVWLIKKCGQSHLGLDDIRMALRWDDDSPLYDSWRTLQ